MKNTLERNHEVFPVHEMVLRSLQSSKERVAFAYFVFKPGDDGLVLLQ